MKPAIVVEGIPEAKAELANWEWGFEIRDSLDEALKARAIDSASVVLDEMTGDQWTFSPGRDPEFNLWPIGGDHCIFAVDLRAVFEEWIEGGIQHHRPEDTAEFIVFLREMANRYESALNAMPTPGPATDKEAT